MPLSTHTRTIDATYSQSDLNINPVLFSQYLQFDVEPVWEQYENHLSTLARNIQRCLKARDITGFKSFLCYFDAKQKKTIVTYKIDGTSCVHIACRSYRVESVQFMLDECGIDPNMRLNSLNQTPLHIACQSGKIGVCKCLIAYGAGVHLVTTDGQSCLALAGENQGICKLLISNGVDVNAWKNKDNMPMIFDACENGDDSLVRFLVDHHANMMVKDKRGLSPIEVAARFYINKQNMIRIHPEMVHILIKLDTIESTDKSKALELIGCVRIKLYALKTLGKRRYDKFKPLHSAKRYWQKSLEYKVKEQTSDHGNRSSCHSLETRTFDRVQKFKSLEDLERIFLNRTDILVQAAIVIESNLGIDNDQTILMLKYLSKACLYGCLADDGIQILTSVFNYILVHIPDVVGKSWLKEFQFLFLYWVRFLEKYNSEETFLTFNTMIWFLDHLTSSSSSVGNNVLSYLNVETIFAVLKYIANWKCTTKRESCLRAVVSKFLNHNFTYKYISLLHRCIKACFCWQEIYELRSLNCIQLVRYLLESGMSPDITDLEGHTPLIKCTMYCDYLNSTREDVIKLLIEYSHLDMVTHDGHSALTMLKAIGFSFTEVCYVPLQCLAAKVILKENIPYKSVVPTRIADFIETHKLKACQLKI